MIQPVVHEVLCLSLCVACFTTLIVDYSATQNVCIPVHWGWWASARALAGLLGYKITDAFSHICFSVLSLGLFTDLKFLQMIAQDVVLPLLDREGVALARLLSKDCFSL